MDNNENKDLMREISETVTLAFKVQEEYLKQGPFPELSLTEVHVIEAVSKESFPTMSNVAKRLQVTVGTLTTNVKSIIKKGFLTKETYEKDHRFIILRITSKGYEALHYHDTFHASLSKLYSEKMTPEEMKWVYEMFGIVRSGLLEYHNKIHEKK